MRAGLHVPDSDTLVEIPVSQGEKYARYFRIAVLRPDETHPLKLAFGCDEKPFDWAKGKQSWFNPNLISPDKALALREIIFHLIAAEVAFETCNAGLQVPDQAITKITQRIVEARNNKELAKLATRFIRMIEG